VGPGQQRSAPKASNLGMKDMTSACWLSACFWEGGWWHTRDSLAVAYNQGPRFLTLTGHVGGHRAGVEGDGLNFVCLGWLGISTCWDTMKIGTEQILSNCTSFPPCNTSKLNG